MFLFAFLTLSRKSVTCCKNLLRVFEPTVEFLNKPDLRAYEISRERDVSYLILYEAVYNAVTNKPKTISKWGSYKEYTDKEWFYLARIQVNMAQHVDFENAASPSWKK